MNLFGCVSDVAVIKRVDYYEEEFVNKILSEGLKLQQKCKSLSKLLADTESQRKLEQDQHQQKLRETEERNCQIIEEMRTMNMFDIKALQETHLVELDSLSTERSEKIKEIVKLGQRMDCLVSLVKELEDRIDNQKEMYESLRETDKQKLEILLNELKENEIEVELLRDSVVQLTCERNTVMNILDSAQLQVQQLQQTDSSDNNRQREHRYQLNNNSNNSDSTSCCIKIANHNSSNSCSDQSSKCTNEFSSESLAPSASTAFLDTVSIDNDPHELIFSAISLESQSPLHSNSQSSAISRADYDDLYEKYIAAQDEILILKGKLQQLISAKQTVEYCVQQVLTENKNLKDRINSLSIT